MKVTVNGFDIEGTEDEIMRLLQLMSQNGSHTTEEKPAYAPRRRNRRTTLVGPREAEVVGIMRELLGTGDEDKNGIRSNDLAPLVNWGDIEGDSPAARSRTSATLSNLQKKRIVVRPDGESRWYLTRMGRTGALILRGGDKE